MTYLVTPGANDALLIASLQILNSRSIELHHLRCHLGCDCILTTVYHRLLQNTLLPLSLEHIKMCCE